VAVLYSGGFMRADQFTDFSPKEILEIKGAKIYMFVMTAMLVVASVAQYIGGSQISIIMPTFFGYSFCVFLAYVIYRRKIKKKSVTALQWTVAILTMMFAVYARFNYVRHYDWEYSAGAMHVAAVALTTVIALQYFYNKVLYFVFMVIYFLSFVIFYALFFSVGAYSFHILGHLPDGSIFHGINVISHFYYILMTTIIVFLAYKTIPVVEDLDRMTTEQREKIEKQSRIQHELSNDVRARMNELFPQIEKQEKIADDFNDKMQAQAASFEQISATLEELLSSSENISGMAEHQVDENNRTEDMVREFKKIKEDTKSKLNQTLDQIKVIVSDSGKGKEKLEIVEKTVTDIKTQSSSIANMIGIITDIADRINLLSLNASIEAARAGDQGRGFAVVADEIGKLATQTTDSIKQIESILLSSTKTTASGVEIIRDTSTIVKTMMKNMIGSSDKIGELQESITREETYIEQIYGQMKKSSELASTTEIGTSEQKIALQSTVKVIEHLNLLVEELVSGVDILTRSSSNIAKSARVLLDKTDQSAVV